MENYKEKNTEILRRLYPDIFQKIAVRLRSYAKDIEPPCPGTLVKNNAGDVNLRLPNGDCLHNFDSPWQEADEHLTMLSDDFEGIALFCGFGLGYWPLRMLAQGYNPALTVIIEPSLDIFLAALECMDLSPVLSAPNVLLFIGDINWQSFEAAVAITALFETTCFFRLHAGGQQREKLYKETDDKAFSIMNSLNIQGATLREKGPIFFHNTLRNLTLLPNSPPMNCLQGLFKDKPAVIVSAGPSLNNDLDGLRLVKDKCVIIAVDSAAKPLFEAGIIPDFITSIDFQELNIEKLAPLLGQNQPVSLVSLIKEAPSVPKTFRAAHTFLAFQDDEQDTWLTRALGIDCFISSGSSVAHLGLGLARFIGASPICFIGQDLAFAEVGSDHAQGTVFAGDGLPKDTEILSVPGIGGGTAKTDRCFLEFLNQLEQIIDQHPNKYLNLTSTGARIHGTEEMDISTAAGLFFKDQLRAQNIIEHAVKQSAPYDISGFLNKCGAMLKKLRQTRRKISDQSKLVVQEIAASRKTKIQKQNLPSLADLPPGRQKNMRKIDRINNILDNEHELWLYLQTVSLDMFCRNQKALAANQKLREHDGYGSWLSAELNRIKAVNNERDKILAKFQLLLTDLYNHLKKVSRLSEKDFTHTLTAADLYFKSGDISLMAKALDRYELLNYSAEMQHQTSANEQARYYLLHGIAMANFLDFEQANLDWKKSVSLDNSLSREINKNRQNQARRWFKNLSIIFAPNLMEMWIDRAAALSNSLSAPEVREIYTDMDTIPKYLALFARRLIERGNFEAGITVLQDAVAKDPDTAGLWEEIGDVLTNDNDNLGAMQAYQNCYLAQPQNTQVLEKFKISASRQAARQINQ